MGLFDIFRSKVKDLGDSLDENELTAEEGTEEAQKALESKINLELSKRSRQESQLILARFQVKFKRQTFRLGRGSKDTVRNDFFPYWSW